MLLCLTFCEILCQTRVFLCSFLTFFRLPVFKTPIYFNHQTSFIHALKILQSTSNTSHPPITVQQQDKMRKSMTNFHETQKPHESHKNPFLDCVCFLELKTIDHLGWTHLGCQFFYRFRHAFHPTSITHQKHNQRYFLNVEGEMEVFREV